ncbi:MAG: twin-arginine translocase subunit TatC [Rhodothermales bacterium]|nr:twin-arginine translocase subunit TatC [Rhodothermales bacterium]
MSFLDHLEEFRWALIRGSAGVILATIVAAFFSKWIIDVLLLGPAKSDFFVYNLLGIEAIDLDLQNRTITGQFFAHWGTILAVGAILGSPVFVFQLWKFIEPGLYSTEKRGLRFAAVFATMFFMLGIAFGYCVVTPFALQFFSNYQISDQIVNDFDIARYFSMVTFWAFGAGILFELPVAVYFLSKIGILTPVAMRKYRRYALVIIMFLGAMFTPPDPLSMVLVAVPLFGLYQLSILISSAVAHKREKELEEALS